MYVHDIVQIEGLSNPCISVFVSDFLFPYRLLILRDQ